MGWGMTPCFFERSVKSTCPKCTVSACVDNFDYPFLGGGEIVGAIQGDESGAGYFIGGKIGNCLYGNARHGAGDSRLIMVP
jgi:hypothetical protein